MATEFECAKRILPTREFEVVVCGGGTAGVFAAIASARNGAKTALVESKGYVGGIAAEGGCGLHSFYNVYKPYPDVSKRKVVQGIPSEFIDRLTAMGGASGHNEAMMNYAYDSDALCVDVEAYKYLAMTMVKEAGVTLFLNAMVTETIKEDAKVTGVVMHSHQGSEVLLADIFIDATGYGDISAQAGAAFTEPNDMAVANSMGIGGFDIDSYYNFLKEHDALSEYAYGPRSGKEHQIIRVDGNWDKIEEGLAKKRNDVGLSSVTTTIFDNYLMFLKINFRMEKSPTNVDALSDAEYQLRKRQQEALQFFKEQIPGAEKAFITRTGPCVAIRRGRCIACEYDMTIDDISNAKHFGDDVFSYGFHDMAPRFHVGKGETFGLPYRAMVVKGIENLFAVGMMISTTHEAHMSTRNTVSCMAQGQAAGTAAALAVKKNLSNVRSLDYKDLYQALVEGKVWFDVDPFTQAKNY
jgi:hypothetical protein